MSTMDSDKFRGSNTRCSPRTFDVGVNTDAGKIIVVGEKKSLSAYQKESKVNAGFNFS